MRTHIRPAPTIVGLLLTTILTGGILAAATPAAVAAQHPMAVPVVGTGQATAHSTNVSSAMASDRTAPRADTRAPLGRDGRPAGSALGANTSSASGRPAPNDPPVKSGGPNTGRSAASATPSSVRPAAVPAIGVQGASQGNSGCAANCPKPDVTAAVNSTEIAETVNSRLQVVGKSGGALCGVSLNALLGALTSLAGPRIQYDTTNKRFSLVVDSVPASSSDVPVQYLATSQGDDACGAWWVYSIIFSGTGYPSGALLDFPYLGQDNTSLLTSTNNFSFSGSYLGSTAYAMPKSVAYTGSPFSFNTYSVAFSTAPVTVAGIPIRATTNTYWLAAVPGTGYDLYVMPTKPAGAISLQATIHSPFSAPSRRAVQPGTSRTLDALDGRISADAVQDGTVVWFAHVVDDQGFPTVRYGGIGVTSNQASTAMAFHDSTSDDVNAAIGVFPAGSNTDYIWVSWAYTDSPAGVPVSDAVAGVGPGEGIPDLAGDEETLVTGSVNSSSSDFGRYSSVAIDPAATSSCPAGLTALTAQEYFNGGPWATELARTSFC